MAQHPLTDALREFGDDYPAADFPEIPASWIDTSWHNDVCPSFLIKPLLPPGKSYGDYLWPCLSVWVDFPKPEDRELGAEIERFRIYAADEVGDLGNPHLETNDWGAVRAFVERFGLE